MNIGQAVNSFMKATVKLIVGEPVEKAKPRPTSMDACYRDNDEFVGDAHVHQAAGFDRQ